MATDASRCPDTQTLDDLLGGRLSADHFAQLEGHVGGCSACGALVAQLAISGVTNQRSGARGLDDADVPSSRAAVASFALVEPDRFEVVREIARGGMGRIVEAWDRRHGRAVALKTLLRPDRASRARFAREARITTSLQHPGIVPLYETGRWADGEPFLAMKLVSGRPFDRVVAAATEVEQRLALLPKVIAMTEALAYAHEKGVVHRDLKPANVLLGSFGETIVIDWGLAKAVGVDDDAEDPDALDREPLSASPGLTRAGVALGTPSYMPPEQARGESVGARADVYALGALLYHVLAGEPPYGRGARNVIERVLAGPPEPLRALVPGLPADLLAIVDKAMSRDPAARYPDARAMAEDLRRFEAGKLVAAHTYGLGTLIARWIARHRALVAMTVALVVAVGSTAALFARRVVRERDRADAARVEADAQRSVAVLQRDAGEHLVGFLLRELMGRLDTLGKLDLLAGLGGEVEGYYGKLASSKETFDSAALQQRGAALQVLAGVEERKGNTAGALRLSRAAVEALAARSLHEPGDLMAMADLAIGQAALVALSQQSAAGGHPVDAGELAANIERATDAARAIAARTELPAWAHVAVGWVDATVAGAAFAAGDAARARTLTAEARAALALVGDYAQLDRVWQDRLAMAHFGLAAMEFRTQEWGPVIESLRVSVAIRRAQRVVNPTQSGGLEQLALSLRWLGEAYENRYEDELALPAHREALELERALVTRESQNVMMKGELAGTLVALCLLEREWEGPATAAPRCAEARAIAQDLFDQNPRDPTAGSLRTRSLEASGEAELAAHHDAAARELLESAVVAARNRVAGARQRNQEGQDERNELIDCLQQLGHAELRLGHAEAARASYREALAIMEPALAASADEFALDAVGELSMFMGDTERGDGARAGYQRAVELFSRSRRDSPDDVEPALDFAKAARKLATSERDAAARAELRLRADQAVAPHLAAGRLSPEQRAELEAAGR